MLEDNWWVENLSRIVNDPDQAPARYFFAAAASEILASRRLPLVPPQHFLLLTKVDIEPMLPELDAVTDEDWERNSRHTISVQRETRSINLSVRARNGVPTRHNQYVWPCDNAKKFPYLMKWLEDFSRTVGHGTLQLARIVKLSAHGQVYSHVDRGLYYLIRDRYHIVLRSPSGSQMQCENQVSTWRPGEVWWFNNHVRHQAFNESDEERVHVIFDVLPDKNLPLVPYLQQYAATVGD